MLLRVLTLNISGHNVSTAAPPGFGPLDKLQAVADLVRRHRPHLLALQEVHPPTEDVLAALLASLPAGGGYQLAASTPSHCGLSQVFAQAALRPCGGTAVGPVALCKIPLPASLAESGDGAEDDGAATEAAVPAEAAAAGGAEPAAGGPPPFFYFAGCHLEPFAEGAPERLDQITDALLAVPPGTGLVLAGDTNMRVKENAAVEALGLGEAFVQAGQPREHAYPWNSRVNRYYGEGTREYIARYDRVYLRGFQATSLRLVADEPLTPGLGDFISDHFGVLTEVRPTAVAPAADPAAAAGPKVRKRRLSPGAGRAAQAKHGPRVLPF